MSPASGWATTTTRPLTGVTGGGLPAEIWRETMARVEDGLPVAPLPVANRRGRRSRSCRRDPEPGRRRGDRGADRGAERDQRAVRPELIRLRLIPSSQRPALRAPAPPTRPIRRGIRSPVELFGRWKGQPEPARAAHRAAPVRRPERASAEAEGGWASPPACNPRAPAWRARLSRLPRGRQVECAPVVGQDQAAVLTGVGALRFSNWIGLR